MATVSPLTKEQHDKLMRALASHERITGESTNDLTSLLGDHLIGDPEKEKAEKAKRDEEAYNQRATLQSRVEDTQQAERKARADATNPDNIQPGNPGPGAEALATEKAKAAGHTGAGREMGRGAKVE